MSHTDFKNRNPADFLKPPWKLKVSEKHAFKIQWENHFQLRTAFPLKDSQTV